MERKKLCIYNRTSECFLSLGASMAADALGYLGQMLRHRSARVTDEGQWVQQPKPIHSLRLFSSRDLVFLDAECRVLQVVESWPSRRIARMREDAASMLSLPVHTIYSSQTQAGHQLVICPPEDMREQLKGLSSQQRQDPAGPPCEPAAAAASAAAPSAPPGREHKDADEPRLVAYDAKDPGLRIYGVREVSPTGLFLATGERWPLGTHIVLTLQRTDSVSDSLLPAIAVEMSVARWCENGMAMEFVRPGALEPLLTEMIGQ